MIGDAELAVLFAEYNARNRASRVEYELHPFEECPHGGNCARPRARKAA